MYSEISPPIKFFNPAKISWPTFRALTVLRLAIPNVSIIALLEMVGVLTSIFIKKNKNGFIDDRI